MFLLDVVVIDFQLLIMWYTLDNVIIYVRWTHQTIMQMKYISFAFANMDYIAIRYSLLYSFQTLLANKIVQNITSGF